MTTEPSTVVIALSGGMDSSLAAALLKGEGWKVTGLHFMFPGSPSIERTKRLAVERVAEHIQIPLSFLDLEAPFDRSVIDPFTEAYLKGLTPNPCVLCNQVMKFDQLLLYADRYGIEYVATGHYARLENEEGLSFALWRGKDKQKEQSYFLHRLSQVHLSRTRFPLGDMTKEEARCLAKEIGLPTNREPESQEICFLSGNDYRVFLESRKGHSILRKGAIVNREGRKLGEHFGTHGFTIGQRHGLGIATPRPYYVMEIRPERNEVVVGRREDIFSDTAEAHSFNWLAGSPPKHGIRVTAQIRYRHRPAPGRLEVLSAGRVSIRFEEPQWAITPGQALVCYEGERVLGGGWIVKK